MNPAGPDEAVGRSFVRAYTLALFVVALLAAMVAWIEVGVIDELEAEGRALWVVVVRVDQVIALVLSPLSLLTVFARFRGWPVAHSLTRIVSIALAIVVPIGTALFVYWLFWVRKQETRVGPG